MLKAILVKRIVVILFNQWVAGEEIRSSCLSQRYLSEREYNRVTGVWTHSL